MRRAALIVLACVGTAAGGCFIPVVSPSYSRVPAVVLPPERDEVVAVAVTARWSHSGTAPVSGETHTFHPAPVQDGEVVARFRPYLSRTHLLWLVVTASARHQGLYAMVKLYRRGCQTVVVGPGGPTVDPAWAPATTGEEQVQAVRDLLYRVVPGQTINYVDRTVEPALSPGSAGPQHRGVLLFAADEFDRLATEHPQHAAACRDEAAKLRRLAAE